MNEPHLTIYLHGLPSHLWHASKHLLETAVAPLLLFYLLFLFTGLNGGILAALGWAVAALTCRIVLRARIPGVLVLTTALLVVRIRVRDVGIGGAWCGQPCCASDTVIGSRRSPAAAGRPSPRSRLSD